MAKRRAVKMVFCKSSGACRSTKRSCLLLLAILLVAGCTSAQMEPYVTVDEKAACDRGVATQNRQVIAQPAAATKGGYAVAARI